MFNRIPVTSEMCYKMSNDVCSLDVSLSLLLYVCVCVCVRESDKQTDIRTEIKSGITERCELLSEQWVRQKSESHHIWTVQIQPSVAY